MNNEPRNEKLTVRFQNKQDRNAKCDCELNNRPKQTVKSSKQRVIDIKGHLKQMMITLNMVGETKFNVLTVGGE